MISLAIKNYVRSTYPCFSTHQFISTHQIQHFNNQFLYLEHFKPCYPDYCLLIMALNYRLKLIKANLTDSECHSYFLGYLFNWLIALFDLKTSPLSKVTLPQILFTLRHLASVFDLESDHFFNYNLLICSNLKFVLLDFNN